MRRLSLAALLAWLAACSSEAGPPEALMAAGDLRAHPWPSDALRGSDGRLAVAPPFPFEGTAEGAWLLAEALSQLDGFGTTTSVFFPVSAPVELDAGAAATVIDLEGFDPDLTFPLFYRAETRQLVAVAPPGTVLREHHRYGCVVASGVHDGKGRPLRPSPAMEAALAARASPAYVALTANLLALPQAATAFTTQSLRGWVPKVAEGLSVIPPKAHPTRVFHEGAELDALYGGTVTTTRPGRPASGGALHDHVGAVVLGTFDSPNYLAASPADLGTFLDPPAVRATQAIPFILVLPKRTTATSATTPAGGFPVAIFQHGINGDRSTVLLVANDYAARGYATFGIDALWHGSRLPGAPDAVNNLSGTAPPDGIGDPGGLIPVAHFFDLFGDSAAGVAPLDPRIMRDNFRQSAVDLMQAARVARAGDWSELPSAGLDGITLDGSKLIYTSASFGSMLGAGAVAVDPTIEAAVLDTAGGGLFLDLVGNSATLAPLLSSMVGVVYDSRIDANNPAGNPIRAQMSLNLLQTVVESGDGLALAQFAPPTTSVLFLEVFNDEVVPNHATEALAAVWGAVDVRAGGEPSPRVIALPELLPPQEGETLRALVMLDPAGHTTFTTQGETRTFEDGSPPFVKRAAPVDVTNPIERAHQLALDFMDGFRAGAPIVK